MYKDKFELNSIDKIYSIVGNIFNDNEEYFQIVPQLFVQYFYKHAFEQNQPFLQIEKELTKITKDLSAKTVAQMNNSEEANRQGRKVEFKMNNFEPPKENKVNLFKPAYFNSYE